MPLLQLPLELLVLITSFLGKSDIAHLLRVHTSLHNDVLISELYKKEIKANGGLALCHFANVGNEKGVRKILAAGANADLNVGGETALFKALQRRHLHVVRTLLVNGACPDLANSYGMSPLKLALETRLGDNDILELLLHYRPNVNEKSTEGFYTPLFRAVTSCDPAKVKLLLQHGADANIHDPHSLANPLHYAAMVNAPSEIVRMLSEAGSGIDDYNKDGKTPLQAAIKKSSVRVVKELLNQGADVNLSSRRRSLAREDGKTALSYATKPYGLKPRNSGIIVQLLLQHGADINKTNCTLDAFHLAARIGSVKLAELLLYCGAQINPQIASNMLHPAAENYRKAMVAWLLAQGADVNHKNQASETPIHSAIRAWQSKKDSSIVQRLLSAGATIDYKNHAGLTPLCLAANLSRLATLKLLLEQGADLHTKENQGQTPLHKAVNRRSRYGVKHDLEITKLLIGHGADPNARDMCGCTPLHYAARNAGAQEILPVLLRAGGNVHALSHDGKSLKDMAMGRIGNTNWISKLFAKYGI